MAIGQIGNLTKWRWTKWHWTKWVWTKWEFPISYLHKKQTNKKKTYLAHPLTFGQPIVQKKQKTKTKTKTKTKNLRICRIWFLFGATPGVDSKMSTTNTISIYIYSKFEVLYKNADFINDKI